MHPRSPLAARRSPLAAAAVLIAAPRLARADGTGTLRFVPYADVAIIDPIWSTNDAPRTHAHLVVATLFGVDEADNPHPQMLGASRPSRRAGSGA